MKPPLYHITKKASTRSVALDEPELLQSSSLPHSPNSTWTSHGGLDHDSKIHRIAVSAPYYKTRFDQEELQVPRPSGDSPDSATWKRYRSWSDESDARIARVVLSPLMKPSPDMSSLQVGCWADITASSSSNSADLPSSPMVHGQRKLNFEQQIACDGAFFDLPYTPRAEVQDASDASGSALCLPIFRSYSNDKPNLSHSPSTTITTSGPVTPNVSGATVSGDGKSFNAQLSQSPAFSVASILKSQHDAMAALTARWQAAENSRAEDKSARELAEGMYGTESASRLRRDLSTIAESDTGSSYSTAMEQRGRSDSFASSSYASSCPSDSEYDEVYNVVIHHAVRQPPPVWTRAVPSPKAPIFRPDRSTGAPHAQPPSRLQPPLSPSGGDDTLREGSSSFDADATWDCIKKFARTQLASEDSNTSTNDAESSFDLSFTRKYGHTSKSHSLSNEHRATRAAHREAFQLHSRKPHLVSDDALRQALEEEEQSASDDNHGTVGKLTHSQSDTYGLGLGFLSSNDSINLMPFEIETPTSSGLPRAPLESYGLSSPLRPEASLSVVESPVTARIQALLTEIRGIGNTASPLMSSSSSLSTLSLKQRRQGNPKPNLRIIATAPSDANRVSTRLRSPAASSPRDSLCLVSPHLAKSTSMHSVRARAQKEPSPRDKQVITTPPPLPTPTPRSVASAAKAQRILGMNTLQYSPYGPRAAKVVADFEAQTASGTARPSVTTVDASNKVSFSRAKKRRGLLRKAKSMSAIQDAVTSVNLAGEDAL